MTTIVIVLTTLSIVGAIFAIIKSSQINIKDIFTEILIRFRMKVFWYSNKYRIDCIHKMIKNKNLSNANKAWGYLKPKIILNELSDQSLNKVYEIVDFLGIDEYTDIMFGHRRLIKIKLLLYQDNNIEEAKRAWSKIKDSIDMNIFQQMGNDEWVQLIYNIVDDFGLYYSMDKMFGVRRFEKIEEFIQANREKDAEDSITIILKEIIKDNKIDREPASHLSYLISIMNNKFIQAKIFCDFTHKLLIQHFDCWELCMEISKKTIFFGRINMHLIFNILDKNIRENFENDVHFENKIKVYYSIVSGYNELNMPDELPENIKTKISSIFKKEANQLFERMKHQTKKENNIKTFL